MKTVIKSFLFLVVAALSASTWAQSSITVGSGQGLAGATGVVIPVNLTTGGDNIAGIDMTVTFTTASQYSAIAVDCGVQTVSGNVFPSCSVTANVVTIQIAETAGQPWVSGLLANITVDVDGNAVPLINDPLIGTVVGAGDNSGADLNPLPTAADGAFTVLAGPQPEWTSVPSSSDASPQFDFGILNIDDAPPSILPLTVTNTGETGSLLNGDCYMGAPQSQTSAPQAASGFSIVTPAPQVVDLATDGGSVDINIQFDPTVGVIGTNTGMVTCEHNGAGIANGVDSVFGVNGEPSPVTYDLTAHVKGYQVIDPFTATPTPDPAAVNGTAALAATGGASGNDVIFGSSTTDVCTVTGSTVTHLIGGTCTVTANQAGNADYNAATEVSLSYAVNKLPQTITGFTTPTAGVVDGSGALTATATSTLDVAYASDTPAVCTVADSTVSYLTAGACNLTANQAGDDRYEAAPEETLTITVDPADQTITFPPAVPPAGMVGGSSTLNATATSGLDVIYSSGSPTICTVAGSVVSYIAVGTCSVTANQPGDANYNAADPVSITIDVAKGDQVITNFAVDPAQALLLTDGTLSATGGASGNPIVFGSTTPETCTVSGDVVSYVAIGPCTVTADQAGDDNWNAAAQVTLTITVLSPATGIPTLSTWGLITMFLAMLGLGGIVSRRRKLN